MGAEGYAAQVKLRFEFFIRISSTGTFCFYFFSAPKHDDLLVFVGCPVFKGWINCECDESFRVATFTLMMSVFLGLLLF